MNASGIAYDIVVAHDENKGIGLNNSIPFRFKNDMKWFKSLTVSSEIDFENKPQTTSSLNAVIMGRKTWESLPDSFSPLPERMNIILSRTPEKYALRDEEKSLEEKSLISWQKSFNDALQFAHKNCNHIFVIGGEDVYNKVIKNCRNLYITKIKKTYSCDAFFPSYEEDFVLHKEIKSFVENDIEGRICCYKNKNEN